MAVAAKEAKSPAEALTPAAPPENPSALELRVKALEEQLAKADEAINFLLKGQGQLGAGYAECLEKLTELRSTKADDDVLRYGVIDTHEHGEITFLRPNPRRN